MPFFTYFPLPKLQNMARTLARVCASRWTVPALACCLGLQCLCTTPQGPAVVPEGVNGVHYVIRADTLGYMSFTKYPWDSHRPPAYRLFLACFLREKVDRLPDIYKEFHQIGPTGIYHDGEAYSVLHKYGLDGALNTAALVQTGLLALSVALFFAALCLYFPPVPLALILAWGIHIVPLVNPYIILSESLAQPLTFLALACLLGFYKKRETPVLALACLFSSGAFLTRSVGIYMLALCSLCLLLFILRDRYRSVRKYALCGLGLFLGYGYILHISIVAGHMSFGTMDMHGNNMVSLYFLDEEDVPHIPTERGRLFAREVLDSRADFEQSYIQNRFPDYKEWPGTRSKAFRYNMLCWPYAFEGTHEIYRKLADVSEVGPLNLLERSRLSVEIKHGVWPRHLRQIAENCWLSFRASMGFEKDFNPSHVVARRHGRDYMRAGLAALSAAILLCNGARFALLILAGTHILSMMACSFGGLITPRYVALTEPFLVYAFALSGWALLAWAWKKAGLALFHRQRQNRTTEASLAPPSSPEDGPGMTGAVAIPLVVDLDGTLLMADSTFLMARHALVQGKILTLLSVFQGRARFKAALAERVDLALSTLPWNPAVLDLMDMAKREGRQVWLATASNKALAGRICTFFHLSGFAASGADRNLKGEAKAAWLTNKFGERGFDYAGNCDDDLPAWAHCRVAYVSSRFRRLDLVKQACGRAYVFPAVGKMTAGRAGGLPEDGGAA